MRILMTTDTVGGVWTFAMQLSSELLARRCHVALVSVGSMPSHAQTTSIDALASRWGTQFRFAAARAPLEWMDENAEAYSAAAPLLLEVAREFRADLILSSQYCYGALPFDGPKIVVAHSDVLSWAKACRPHGLPPSQWIDRYRALVSNGLESADAVVAPTHWMLHALEEHFRIPGELHVIHNGRSISQPSTHSFRRLQAVAAGRLWDEGKNLRILSEVEAPLPLLIAGDSGQAPPQFQGTTTNPILLGHLDENSLLSLFRQSSIYICPSKYEPFGLAPIEAALCGCAVIVNDIPPLREVWGDAALYFQDAESLSRQLARLAGNQLALSLARKQACWRASQFTAWRMTEAYLELFRSVLSREVASHAA